MNVTGHSQTGYYPAHQQRDIDIALRAPVRRAQALHWGRRLPVRRTGGISRLRLPLLGEHELIVLE